MKKKLKLHRETIAILTDSRLSTVRGGGDINNPARKSEYVGDRWYDCRWDGSYTLEC